VVRRWLDGESGTPSRRRISVRWTREWFSADDGTFRHAVQAAQVASLRDTDAQIVMLTVVFVRQEVGEGLCLFEGLSSAGHVDLRL
jgi:hypothetical protein